MSAQAWQPAPKKTPVPLHPMTFGMLLGKSFAALRHNPKVLFGFAVVVQSIALVVIAGVMTAAFAVTFTRLESVPTNSEDFAPIAAGTVAINAIVGIVVSLATLALTALMQAIVAADVAEAALGNKAPLRVLWKRMRPSIWRLIGWALLQAVVVIGAIVLLFGLILIAGLAGGFDTGAGAGLIILLLVLIGLGSIPLFIWLSTKLLLVPSVLVLERSSIRSALRRSWRLTRGRFWVAFGVVFLISMIMGVVSNVATVPASIFSSILTVVIAPTGDPDVGAIIGIALVAFLPYVLTMIVGAIGTVVQCTGATLVYLDSRMRYEGLDQTLLAYQDHQLDGSGSGEPADPFAVDPARAVGKVPPKPAPPAYPPGYPAPGYAPGYPPGYGAPAPGYAPAYPAPSYAPYPPGYPPQAPGTPVAGQAPGYPPAPGYVPPAPGYAPPAPGMAPPPAAAPQPPAADPASPPAPGAPADSPWAAPGSDA